MGKEKKKKLRCVWWGYQICFVEDVEEKPQEKPKPPPERRLENV